MMKKALNIPFSYMLTHCYNTNFILKQIIKKRFVFLENVLKIVASINVLQDKTL